MANRSTIRGVVQIQRPPSEVFAFVADYRCDPIWRQEVRSVQYTTPEPIAAVGSQFVEIAKVLGRKRESWQEIVRCETDALISCATFKAAVPHVSERTVKPWEEGTELEIQMHYDTGKRWRDRFLRRVMRGMEQRRLERALLKLKQLLGEGKAVHTNEGRA